MQVSNDGNFFFFYLSRVYCYLGVIFCPSPQPNRTVKDLLEYSLILRRDLTP